jgi:hypothetical protein
MLELNEYLNAVSNQSKFPCSVGSKGGFINLRNSGKRGSVKEFTLSLESILSGLKDIKENLTAFQTLTSYVENEWRDNGAEYFSDLALNSMITVQTKPCFTSFSKIINWANNIDPHLYDDQKIDLSNESIDTAIKRIEDLSLEFTPSGSKSSRSNQKSDKDIFNPQVTLLPKPFLLLAGISGTGKTRFVREQAKATGSFQETYCLTSVRPDWHEPSDLLGYISRLDGKEKYITTDVLQFIAKAWRAMVDAGLSIETQAFDNQGECLVVSGERDALNGVLPYWLCLDEMNLAPVEQYFADYLSVLETRAWHWDGNSFTYTCDALLKPTTIQAVADNSKLRSDLGFGDAKYDTVWELIGKHGLSTPFNLMVAGTVNMDETTHGFSRKVIDRALSFDFGEFFPNDYDAFFESSHQPKTLSYPLWSHANPEYLKKTFDTDGQKSIAFLTAVNAVLKNTPFELAYRALNELLLSVASAQPKDQTTLAAVWDDFLMCKVLPRIEGDVDKLSSGATSVEAYGQQTSILQRLEAVLAEELELVWSEAGDSPQARPDLYREHKATDAQMIRIACRSRTKLQWMQARLTSAGFTSFWP